MAYSNMIQEINRETGVDLPTIKRVLDGLGCHIITELKNGNNVTLNGLCTFSTENKITNLSQGQYSKRVKCKPCKSLSEKVSVNKERVALSIKDGQVAGLRYGG